MSTTINKAVSSTLKEEMKENCVSRKILSDDENPDFYGINCLKISDPQKD